MKELEFELKKVGKSSRYIQYEVLRKGLYYGLLSIDINEPIMKTIVMNKQ